jgi:hypothetical protein
MFESPVEEFSRRKQVMTEGEARRFSFQVSFLRVNEATSSRAARRVFAFMFGELHVLIA